MDPYKILGVSQSASDEEVKSAYIELVKKYHPDKYVDNPLKELAQEKLKEINEAYDTITRQRKSSSSSSTNTGYTGNSGYGRSYSSGAYTYSGSNANIYQQVRSFLAANQHNRAEQLLNSISMGERNAEWEYLSGILALRRGYYDSAKSHFKSAVEKDPNNPEYNQAYRSVNGVYTTYSSNPYRTGNTNDLCNMCSCLLCSNLCLNGLCFRC